MFADGLVVALEITCELLPSEIQPTVKCLLELREALWHREIEPRAAGQPCRQHKENRAPPSFQGVSPVEARSEIVPPASLSRISV